MQRLLACGEALQAAPFSAAVAHQVTAGVALAGVFALTVQCSKLGPAATTETVRCVGLPLGAGCSS